MARTKHNKTGNGSHRQRLYQYRVSRAEALKAALAAELSLKLPADTTPAKFEVLPEVNAETVNGD